MQSVKRSFVVGALVALISLSCAAAELAGTVVGVTDGDTITILDAAQRIHEIRLANIDAPETTCHMRQPGLADDACVDHGQPHAKEAKGTAMSMLYGRTVTVDLVEINKVAQKSYERDIGIVFENGVDVNYELVKLGLAWHEKHYASKQQTIRAFVAYNLAESTARTKHLGIWADPDPIPPWEWRHQRKYSR